MSNLPRRTLGRTGVEVTTLGYGAMELRGASNAPGVSDEDAERVLNAVLDLGINFIDTSIDYGRSEERIGRFIAHRRSEYILASKCGCVPNAPQGSPHLHTAANVREGVEHSLRTLGTDYLDLVQFHRSLTPAEFREEGGLQELQTLQREGKVRFIGVSGTLPNLVDQIGMDVFDAFQIPYSALQREEEEAIRMASNAGSGIIIRGGVARGMPTDWERRRYYMQPGTIGRDRWESANLDDLLDGMSRQEFMLRFTISEPNLDTTIVGTGNIDHLRSNVEMALKGPLPADLIETAKQRLSEVGSRPATLG